MNDGFILRSGKYAGKTVNHVRDIDNWYLVWVEENRPEMLKEIKPKIAKPSKSTEMVSVSTKSTAMSPNLNFYNEGPSELSKPYLNKMKELEEKIDDEWNF